VCVKFGLRDRGSVCNSACVFERVSLLEEESCACKKRKASMMHECQYRIVCKWRRKEKDKSTAKKREE
jgi:hypothetical protein